VSVEFHTPGVPRKVQDKQRENGGGTRKKMFCVGTKRLIRPPTHPDTPQRKHQHQVRIDGTRKVSARFRSTIWKYPFGATQRARVEAGDGVSLAIPNKHHPSPPSMRGNLSDAKGSEKTMFKGEVAPADPLHRRSSVFISLSFGTKLLVGKSNSICNSTQFRLTHTYHLHPNSYLYSPYLRTPVVSRSV
jgi:hypothetical protein